MKTTALTTVVHFVGAGCFLFYVSLGITASATMIGMTAFVAWAVASMIAIESRRPILETEVRPISCASRRSAASNVEIMPPQLKPAA